ncbi:MAG: bifunctional glutamate N-acetyltransferase/amino-acid acetyltransferase ArgJ, partial [Bacillota bacterium]|nr:bifunctional glutamate N-acetyltransferase/amino-acid acetyltransferase ArgJ [Bacillota bacterium]
MAQFAGAVTAAQGFQAIGVHVGVKSSNTDKKDIALIYSEKPCTLGAMFTTNVVKAAPVQYDIEILAKGTAQAVFVNSGNANACTGSQGHEDVRITAKAVARSLGIAEDLVLVSSTGVIGQNMPMDRILAGVELAAANLSAEGGHEAAEAILTTDLHTKEMALKVDLDGVEATIGGIAKGSGMICPHMATMLAFITTDAVIEQKVLQQALTEAVAGSFNQISVDGDMSTNDSVILLANGLAGNAAIEPNTKAYQTFVDALTRICVYLAKKIARDGEGATHLLEVRVEGAKTLAEARQIAKSIVSSNLVKAAIFGKDANWGRIICAAGYAGVDFDASKVDIYLQSYKGKMQVAKNGGGLVLDENYAALILGDEEVTAVIDLHEGEAVGLAWGCDLSYDY